MTTVQLLGGIAVHFSDGRAPVTKFRTRKAALLLAYLALHPGQAQSRELLLELFWPDAPLESGRSNLSTTLSMLRRQIGDVFDADHATVRLRAEGVSVDALRFEQLARRGLAGRSSEALREAAALWGPPLPGVYDDWAVDLQTRLEALVERVSDARDALPEAVPDAPSPPGERDPLPPLLSRSFGRDDALAQVAAALGETRLLSLLGPGGVGKTRLSLETARALGGRFVRTVFVALSELPAPALILPTLRRALTDAPPPADPLADTVAQLNATPGEALLILDNLEHLLPADGDDAQEKSPANLPWLVRRLLENCPRLTVLTTSRQPLGLDGERLYPVPLLPVDDAVALFVDRARAVRPDFSLHPGNRAALEALCTRLEGLPLAIELAAAWARSLPLDALLERLERELLWLEGRRRDLSPRQKSLEATLRWSWQLLAPDERRLLAALSVFRGGWDLAAAEAVHGADPLAALDALVEKSLVEAAPDARRYGMLESLRHFARARLVESGDAAATRHRNHFLALAQAAEPKLAGAEQAVWLATLDAECDNLRAALEFSLSLPEDVAAGQALAGALGRYWRVRGLLDEGRRWCRRLLDTGGGAAGTAARAATLNSDANLANLQGDYAGAEAASHESLAIGRAIGDDVGCAGALNNLGNAALSRGDLDAAQGFLEESLALRRRLDDPGGTAVALNNLGNVAQRRGDLDRARQCHEESLAIKRTRGDENGIGSSLLNLGNVAMLSGDLEGGEAFFRQSLALRHRLGDRSGVTVALESLANIARLRGAARRSALLFGAAERLHATIGSSILPVMRAEHQSSLRRLRETLGDAAFDAAWDEGYGLTLDGAVAYAL